ncbi:MAG TPA: hypothetical protein DIC23_02410 [Planctomycetaceae bacterium]|nr:hypothetical protein [Planctomycetaceae bacterium]HCK52040.1 hypothetical protein [Planctomycetaceae bacterium]
MSNQQPTPIAGIRQWRSVYWSPEMLSKHRQGTFLAFSKLVPPVPEFEERKTMPTPRQTTDLVASSHFRSCD